MCIRDSGIPEDAVLLLAFGGSLGAQHINRFMVSIKDELLSRSGVYVLHSLSLIHI